MTTPSDATLLNAFARDRDEAAFRILAERHLSLVFHAALRKTGSRVLAQDVSQKVLCAVASKAASLARHPERFVPWLHRATLYESAKAMRSEASQNRRKELLHPDDIPAGAGEDEEAWATALPHLDDALDRLPEADRRVLMLHFFEKLSFPKIGGLVGKSPAAAQKQSVRALEKLSRILRSRGVVVPVGLLATGMFAESAKALPVNLVPSLTLEALSLAAKPTLSHGLLLMLTGNTKLLVPCSMLLLALPLGLQQFAIARAERELASLRRTAPPPAIVAREPRESPGLIQISTSLDLVRLADEAEEANRFPGLRIAFDRKLAAVDKAELARLLKATQTVNTGMMKRQYLAGMLADALAEKDLALAMESLADGWLTTLDMGATAMYERWATADVDAAQAWLEKMQALPEYRQAAQKEHEEAGEGREGWRRGIEEQLARMDSEEERREKIAWTEGDSLRRVYDNGVLQPLQQTLLDRLMTVDEGRALAYLESFPPHTRQMALISGAYGYPQAPLPPAEAAAWLKASRMLPQTSREVMVSDFATHAMGNNLSALDLSKMEPLLEAEGALPEEKRLMAEAAVKLVIEQDPSPEKLAEVKTWLDKMMPAEAGAIQAEASALIHAKQRSEALGDLEYFSTADGTPDDARILYSLSTRHFRGDLTEQALQWADKIQDASMREKAKQTVIERAK